LAGVVFMFGPVIWLVMSSFKTPSALTQYPPAFLPYTQRTAQVEGFESPLPLFDVTFEDGTVRRMAQVRRVGIEAQMIDPAKPAEVVRVNINQRVEVREIQFATTNYTEPLDRFNFWTYLRNSVVVTVVATLITLIVNSMAAFALSKYQFKGSNLIFVITIGTLMIPITVILVPVYLVITQVGWNNNLWGVIIPGAATPTGVFLLRQYMLTIPDELLDSARIDGSSEWRIYWQIVLPLARPALAVLAIFSVMWRWNDFLWPLIVLSRNELFTLQVGLNAFQGELNTQWHYVLAMTVLSLLPITLVFAFLQRFITAGIATTGMK
jgi:alpha-1,4-digalacturonate transport system permease protein